MANPFDRFDEEPANPFDRFDAPRSRRRRNRLESASSGAVDAATFGFGDEIKGGIDAGVAAVRGQDAGQAYGRSVQTSREYQRQAREDNPLSYLGGQLAGSFVPGSGVVRGTNALMQGSRSLRTFSQARPVSSLLASGAAGGAVGGGIYGASSATEGQRTQGAISGAGQGAVWGAGLAPLAPLAGAAMRGGSNALNRMRQNGPNAARNIMSDRSGSVPLPQQGPSANEFGRRAVADVERLSRRARLEVDDLEAGVTAARVDPRGRTLADIIGQPARAKVRSSAAMPGQTGALAEDVLGARARGQLGRLTNDVEGTVGATTGPQARARIEAGLQDASENLYTPTMGKQVSEEGMAAIQPILNRFPPQVVSRAEQVMSNLARTEGYDVARLTSAERLHFLKRALSDTVQTMGREGLGADEARAYGRLLREFTDQMDTHIPGYAGARGRWRELKGAEEAVEIGDNIFKPSTRIDDIRERVAAMTPEQVSAMRAGLRDRIVETFMRTNRDGRRNVAASLEDTLSQQKLRAALGDAEADKLIAAIRAESDLFQSGSAMTPRSDTAANAANALEDGLAAEVVRTAQNPVAAPGRWAGSAVNALVGRGVERRRDQLGNVLLMSADDAGKGYDAEQVNRLMRVLRDRARRARQRTSDAAQGGISGSIGADE